MASPARINGHPIHPILVAFPIGLWVFSLVCDVVYIMGWGGSIWNDVAFYSMAGGIVGALLAAAPGLIDLISISDPKVKSIGIRHMTINLIIVALFAFNLWLRMGSAPGSQVPMALSVLGVVLLGVSGWLGGEMVFKHAVGVEPQPDARQEGRDARAV